MEISAVIGPDNKREVISSTKFFETHLKSENEAQPTWETLHEGENFSVMRYRAQILVNEGKLLNASDISIKLSVESEKKQSEGIQNEMSLS